MDDPRAPSATDERAGPRGGTAPARGGCLSVIFLPTLTCNCRCTHCFEELDGRTVEAPDWAPLFDAMRDIARGERRSELRIHWQGGEVLCLEPSEVARGLDTAEATFAEAQMEVHHYLQTNLLLYDSVRWRDVLSRFATMRLGSSLDHPNLFRLTARLDPEAYVEEWLDRKRAAEADGFRVSVIAVLNPASLEEGAERFFAFFRDVVQPIRLQVNLPFSGPRDPGRYELDPEATGDFLVELYDVWNAGNRQPAVSPFDALERRLWREEGGVPCVFGRNCGHSMLAIGPGGEAAQCDCWAAGFDRHPFGSVLDGGASAVLGSEARRAFQKRPVELLQSTACGECRFWNLCHGGCPARAYATSGTIEAPDPYCPSYQKLFQRMLVGTS